MSTLIIIIILSITHPIHIWIKIRISKNSYSKCLAMPLYKRKIIIQARLLFNKNLSNQKNRGQIKMNLKEYKR
jgi:hypothetical protein